MKNQLINSLLAEFRLNCQEYYICLKFASTGIRNIAEKLAENKPTSTARLWISEISISDGGDATTKRNYASISMEKYLASSIDNGAFSNEIAKAFVCTIYSLWDETYRNLIAENAQVDQKQVYADLMGDLRHIRHCIIHSKSTITKEHEKIKVLSWNLQPGALVITQKMFADLINQINEMPVGISRFNSSNIFVQKFYDSLIGNEKTSFDSWISKQEPGTDIKTWPQWGLVAKRMPWLSEDC